MSIETMIEFFRRLVRMRHVIGRNLSLLDSQMHDGRDIVHITHGINMWLRRAHGAIDHNTPAVDGHLRQIKAKPFDVGPSA